MTRLNEIEERMSAIGAEIENPEADIEALHNEMRSLKEERDNMIAEEQKREEIRKAVADGTIPTKTINKKEERKMYEINSVEYRNAWLKKQMGKELSAEERANTGMDSATTSGGYAIPTMTLNRIIENMVKVAPMLGEVDLMHIPGNVTIAVESTVNAAALHTENAALTAQDDVLTKVSLGGYEICKIVPISAKLDVMSVDAFEDWIVSNLSRSVALVVENYIINGTGSSQPKGIDAAETWTDGTNAVDFAAAAPTVAELQELIGLQNAAYIGNAKFLMNWKTFWNNVHALRDDKNPEIVSGENGKYRIFGFPVIISAKVVDGDIFFGDFFEGVKANFAQDITVESDRSSGFRSNAVDYRGACVFDCATVAGRIVKGAGTL